jgi:hypothetical protein
MSRLLMSWLASFMRATTFSGWPTPIRMYSSCLRRWDADLRRTSEAGESAHRNVQPDTVGTDYRRTSTMEGSTYS